MNDLPRPLDVQIEHCKQAIAANDVSRAALLARELAAAHPTSMVAYNLLGNAAIRSGDPETAIRYFDVAIRLDLEKSVPPRLNHAMALQIAGHSDAALEAYQALHNDHSSNESISGKFARILFERERFDTCLEVLGGIRSFSFDQFFMRGRCRVELGQSAQAIADLQEALRLRPAYPEAFKALGEALAQVGRRKEALDILRPLCAQQPGNADLNYTLGRIYFDLKQLALSRDHLTAAVSSTRHTFAVNRHLGIVHRMLGADAAAVPFLKAAHALDPEDYLAFDNLGEALTALVRFEELKAVTVSTLGRGTRKSVDMECRRNFLEIGRRGVAGDRVSKKGGRQISGTTGYSVQSCAYDE